GGSVSRTGLKRRGLVLPELTNRSEHPRRQRQPDVQRRALSDRRLDARVSTQKSRAFVDRSEPQPPPAVSWVVSKPGPVSRTARLSWPSLTRIRASTCFAWPWRAAFDRPSSSARNRAILISSGACSGGPSKSVWTVVPLRRWWLLTARTATCVSVSAS